MFLNLQKYIVATYKKHINTFRITHDFVKYSLSLETSQKNIFLRFKEAFIKTYISIYRNYII